MFILSHLRPGNEDHLEIVTFLRDLSSRNVHLLGIALGISHHRLNDSKDATPSFVSSMIADWLHRVDMVSKTTGEPSWRSLVSALRHDIVKQTGIANKIAADKKQMY